MLTIKNNARIFFKDNTFFILTSQLTSCLVCSSLYQKMSSLVDLFTLFVLSLYYYDCVSLSIQDTYSTTDVEWSSTAWFHHKSYLFLNFLTVVNSITLHEMKENGKEEVGFIIKQMLKQVLETQTHLFTKLLVIGIWNWVD